MKSKYFTFIFINLFILMSGFYFIYNSSKTNQKVIPVSQIHLTTHVKKIERVFSGEITTSFFSSALNSGLSVEHILTLTESLKYSINFVRGIRHGDKFKVILNNEATKIDTLILQSSNQILIAKTDINGVFHDQNGVNLSNNDTISPLKKHYAVSSHFSNHRTHPILKRIQPHLGTDFKTPIGTPTYAINKGIIITSTFHPLAGNYIVIQHANSIKTRYLHLNNRMVNKGDIVYKGQKIGLTGNTGRTTGPHLHFEYLKDNIPINFEKIQKKSI
ncbi:peptidoglycan DD-metalloendopeptidase family protein [Aliivibrio sifiae]|uniref:peptidoglycan DD-metalloendopeptidase family protein n=1 Tax=Aliivibrio sifiae TaxID=566293 RepID=UPI003D131DAF